MAPAQAPAGLTATAAIAAVANANATGAIEHPWNAMGDDSTVDWIGESKCSLFD